MAIAHLRNVRGFFSDYYLGRVFGRRMGRGPALRPTDRDVDVAIRGFFAIRARAESKSTDPATCREAWVRPLLRDVLGFHLGAGEGRVHLLYADAQAEADGKPPLAVAYCGAWDEDLDVGRGKARPVAQVESALAARALRWAFLVTGERLRLARPTGDGPRGAYVEADLDGLAEDSDPTAFGAVLGLFRAASYLPDAGGTAAIEAVDKESRQEAQKVSEDLKGAVFTAAETLADGLIADAVSRGDVADATRLGPDDLRQYRDAALLALYRLLFILYAEARDPRLDEHTPYRDGYSASSLVETLLGARPDAWAANRHGLWSRLVALFRIFDKGLPAITPWQNIPPRGGDFFSAGSAEGAILEAARLPDPVVARLVLDLATTPPRSGVGRERISFRELDIESLGAVYEGLLDFEPRVATEPAFDVRLQQRPLVLPSAELARLCEARGLRLAGDPVWLTGTDLARLHADADDDVEESDADESADDEADDGEEAPAPKKGGIVRVLRRVEAGAFHFVPGPGRKGSGSFYTPQPLVRDLVRHALGPAVESRRAAEIEALRVCDPACGSAHFLVEAMRFLGRALHRAYAEEHGKKGPPAFRATLREGWDDNWQASDADARAANSEARAWCKRRIAERCLFGVDLNPTAVMLARVALWVESVAGDRPLTYFEHHIRNGNSLAGTWLARLHEPPLPGKGKRKPSQFGLFDDQVRRKVAEAARLRRLIDAADPEALRREGIEADSVPEQAFKDRQRKDAEATIAAARLLFDLRSSALFVPAIWAEWEVLQGLVGDMKKLEAYVAGRPWAGEFKSVQARERFFHWELEFPEVFVEVERPGFDAVLGNPPWDKVLPAKHDFYARYDVLIREFKGNDLDRRVAELQAARPGLAAEFEAYRKRTTTLAEYLRNGGDFPHATARSQAAHEDVSKYFTDRAARLAREGGAVGFVAPSTLYNGDGAVGLRRFLLTQARIERFYGFENREKVFPIDSRYKFVNLVFRKAREGGAAFDAAFMRHDLAELETDGPRPWMVRLSREEIERLSPETLAFLEYRSARDQEIARRMHEGGPTLGGDGPGAWGAEFFTDLAHTQIFNSARDKDLWTDPKSKRLYTPAGVLGREPADFAETLPAMKAKGFLPVFEGKHVDQFVVGTKPVRWWLSVDAAKAKYGTAPQSGATVVFRNIARNTDERTCLAAVLPSGTVAAETLAGLKVSSVEPEKASAVLNSICFDWALRFRTAGTHVSFTYIRPMPVPPADVVRRLPAIPTVLAWERGVEHVTEIRDVWPDLWAANRAVAEAYGLGPDDFAHILASFPGVAKKRPEFYAYFQEQTAAWHREVGLPELAATTAALLSGPAAGAGRVAETAGTGAGRRRITRTRPGRG